MNGYFKETYQNSQKYRDQYKSNGVIPGLSKEEALFWISLSCGGQKITLNAFNTVTCVYVFTNFFQYWANKVNMLKASNPTKQINPVVIGDDDSSGADVSDEEKASDQDDDQIVLNIVFILLNFFKSF